MVCVGLGGVSLDASVALATSEGVIGVCDQKRITRVRSAGFNDSGLPDEALDVLLERAGLHRADVSRIAIAEPQPSGCALLGADHTGPDRHFALACTAFLTSPFPDATVLVCDISAPWLTVWQGAGESVERVEWPWTGPALADLYASCAAAFGFAGSGGGCTSSDQIGQFGAVS